MPKIYKVSGPPGCGKTTHLLRQIENACRKYDPERIGAVSFSKAAVEEIRTRVKNQLPGAVGRNIRTLHSMCFQLLGLDKSMIVKEGSSKIKDWNSAFPVWSLPVSSSLSDLEDDPTLQSEGYTVEENRKRMARINVLRGTMTPLNRWADDAKAMYRDWSAWCKEEGYFDFTKILEECYKLNLSPSIDVLFIDECQDLSSLQLALAHRWAEETESAVFIGDADQAIYRFSGAVPEDFRDLKTDWSHVLNQSYRVPKSVHQYALNLIRRLGDRREDVVYHPTDVEGRMFQRGIFPDLSLPGTSMILCRCNYMIKRWINYLTTKGIPWHNPYRAESPGWNPTATKLWSAVKTYDQLSRGLEVRSKDLGFMMGLMLVKDNMLPGIKTDRKKLLPNPYDQHEIFGLSERRWFTPEFFQFNRPLNTLFGLTGGAGALLEAHGKEIVRVEPKVVVGTFHSIKGAETDHVWLDTTSSPTIARSVMESGQAFDDEVRLGYVGVTRARETCGLLLPAGIPNSVFL